jgi:hypothetical protein
VISFSFWETPAKLLAPAYSRVRECHYCTNNTPAGILTATYQTPPSPDGEVALRYRLETHGDMRAQ